MRAFVHVRAHIRSCVRSREGDVRSKIGMRVHKAIAGTTVQRVHKAEQVSPAQQTIHAELVTTVPVAQAVQQSIRAVLAPSTTRWALALTILAWTVLLALPAPMALRLAQFAMPEHMSSMHNACVARRGTGAKMDSPHHVQ